MYLVNNYINSIAVDADGSIWFGTKGGVSMFDGINWTNYTSINGLASNNTSYIAIDKQGNKWFSSVDICQTDCGEGGATCPTPCSFITKFDGVNWTYLKYSPFGNIYSIVVDNEDSIWYVHDGKVNELIGGEYFRSNDSLNGIIGFQIFAFAIDEKGNKWFGTECGVSKYDGKNWNYFSSGFAIDRINALARDKSNNIWLGTDNGVLKFDGENWSSYIPANEVLTIALDSEGNLWCGTVYNGVYMFDGNVWINYRKEDGLINNFVTAIAADTKGNKWFGTVSGISKFDGINWTNYTKEQIDDTYFMSFNSLAVDTAGVLFLGSASLYKYDGVEGHSWLKCPWSADIGISDIATNTQSKVWVSAGCGISIASGLKVCLKPASAGYHPFCSIEIDAEGNVWSGNTNGMLFKYDGSNWVTFTVPIDSLPYLYLNDIISDELGKIWIGTEIGLWIFDENAPAKIINSSPVNSTNIIIYSNPVNSELKIKTPDYYEHAIIDIFNMKGEKEYTGLATGTENKINTSNLSNGVYIIKLTSRSGILTQKFIKL